MRSVIEQLGSYQDHLDTLFPAVTATEVLDADAVELEPLTASPRRAWAPVVALGAAFAALIAVGLPVLFLAGGDSVVVDEPTSTVTSTAVLPTTVPPTTVAPIATTVPPIVPATPMTWDRIDDPVVFGGDDGRRLMMDVVVRDGIAVAVGADSADGGDYFDAAVWYSLDGTTWNRVPHDEAVFGGDGHQWMNSVVALESGFLAVGSDGDPRWGPIDLNYPANRFNTPSETDAAVWRSDDGITWVRVPHVDAFSEANGGAIMNDVVASDSGLVAVGLVYAQTEPFATYRWGPTDPAAPNDPSAPRDVDIDVDAAVWRSVDGVSWSRVAAVDEVFGGDTIRQSMIAVTAGGPGFIAVGQEGFDYLGFDEWTPIPRNNTDGRDHVTDNVAAVWTSPDGETWTRIASEASLAHGGGDVTGWATMFDIATYTEGLVAVGRDVWVTGESPSSIRVYEGAAVWLSSDGSNWRRADVLHTQTGPDMHAVTTASDGTLVAGGGMFLYEGAGTWTSQDRGDTWVPHPNEDSMWNGTIQGLAVFGDTVLAVGSFGDDASVRVGMVDGTDG